MRSSAAYISKLKAEALGRTYKVQDTNHRLFTSTLYRGAAGCGPVDYTQLEYVEACFCEYLVYGNKFGSKPPVPNPKIIDGGSVTRVTNITIDCGIPQKAGSKIVDGGKP